MSDKIKGLHTGKWLPAAAERIIPWKAVFNAADECVRQANANAGDSRYANISSDVSASNLFGGTFFISFPKFGSVERYCAVSCDESTGKCGVELKKEVTVTFLDIPKSRDAGFGPTWNCAAPIPASSTLIDSWIEKEDVSSQDIDYDGDVSNDSTDDASKEVKDDASDVHSEDVDGDGQDDVVEEIDAAIAEVDAADLDQTTQPDEASDTEEQDEIDTDSMIYDPLTQITFADHTNAPEEKSVECGFEGMPAEWQVKHIKQDGVFYNDATGGIPPSILINEPDAGIITSILLMNDNGDAFTCNMDYTVDPVGVRWQLSGSQCFDGYENFSMLGISYAVDGAEAVYLELEGTWQASTITCSSTFNAVYTKE